jgi:phosphatidylglycerol---prolipoprotein diacylglyceryl transferase
MVPVLWQSGPIVLRTHDVFSVMAVVVGFALYWSDLRRRGWFDGSIALVSLGVLLGGIVGARVVTGWEQVDDMGRAIDAGTPLSYALLHGNKSLVGAMLGGYVGGVVIKRRLGYNRTTGDAYAIALPVAIAIGRVGCFLSELPLGTATSLPWGMTVDPAAAASFSRCPDCLLPMHPSMLYEIGFALLAIPVLVWARPRIPVNGDLLKAFLLAYGVFRFFVEFVRGNEVQAFGLTGPQLVLIPCVTLLAAHFVRQAWRGVYRVPEPPPALAAVAEEGWRGVAR